MGSAVKVITGPLSFSFKDKNVLYLVSTLFVQQIISASSTLWILRLSENVASGTPFFLNLSLYLLSLLLPYLPTGIIGVLLVTWEQSTIRRYIHLFISGNAYATSLWSDKKKREEFLSTANHESLQTINQSIAYYHGLGSAGLNAFLNILAIGVFVDAIFIYAYSLSLLMSFVLITMQSKRQKALAEHAQHSRIELGKSILSFWDNAVLGNAYNLRFWKNNIDKRLDQAVKANISASIFQELISIGISAATFLPSLLAAAWGMHQHADNPIVLAAFVVIMSKLFVILTHTYDLLYWVVQWTAVNTKIRKILKVTEYQEPIIEQSCAARIDWKCIRIQGEGRDFEHPLSLEVFKKLTDQPGRITIRGKNGCGKSSLLLELKHIFKEDAFYLPPQNHLHFSFDHQGHSTGELLKQQLKEVYKHVEANIILLDEWNANLDVHNQQQLSKLIDRIAKKKCVIEVRHR